MNNHANIVKSLTEMRDACGAAIRVLARHELADEFRDELKSAGVQDGFGVRANELLKLEQIA